MTEQLTWLEAIGASFTLWLSCLIFLFPIDKRPHAEVRIIGMLVISVPCGLVITGFHLWLDWVPLVVGLIFCAAFFLICGDMPLMPALYCAVWAQVVQQIIIEVFYLIYFWGRDSFGWESWIWAGISAAMFGVSYTFVGLTVARWMPSGKKYTVGIRQFALAMLFQAVFFALCRLLTVQSIFANPFYSMSILLAQFCCISSLYSQYTMFSKSAMKKELAALNAMWHQREEQYELAKETISIINRKCHDMKHQLAAIRTMPGTDAQEKYLREVEESVAIYDAMFQTGNEVLDTVLTEKSLYCEANKIQLSCVADGKQLNFMDPVDLYAVMGNALDNAIEAVQKLDETEMRMIDVLICREQKFLVIQVANPLKEMLVFRDGLPVSTKPRDGYHGFGLKSIRRTAAQYDGFVTARSEYGYFYLKILIPLKD